MGRYAKNFCMSIPATLTLIGTFLAILGIIAAYMDLRIMFYAIDIFDDDRDYALVIYSPIVFFSFHIFFGIINCTLCCQRCYMSTRRFFKFYIICSVIYIASIFISAIIKIKFSVVIAIFYFLFFIVATLCLIIVIMARQELMESKVNDLQQFNSGQGGFVAPQNDEEFPKYPMSVQVEKIEEGGSSRAGYSGMPEAEFLHRK